MLSIFPWALMALAPLAEARFGVRPVIRNNETETIRCCPCISSDLGPDETTVTVTITSPKETVTIDHTVVEPAITVHVTHTLTPGSPSVVTHEVTIHSEPPAKIGTVIDASPSSEASAHSEITKTVTKTVQLGSDQSESPKTVTVTLKPDQSSASAIINVGGESKSVVETPSLPSNAAVTVTITPQKPDSQQSAAPSRSTDSSSPAEPSRSNNGQGIGASTVTVTAATRPQASHTIEPKPSIKTVTFVEKPSVPSVETVTFVESPAGPSTTTITSGNLSNSTAETVTFVANPVSPSTTTVTIANNPSKPGVETVPFVENPTSPSTTTATLAGNPSDSTVDTVTFVENPPKPSSTAAVVPTKSSSNPDTQTVTFDSNPGNPAVETVTFVVNPPNSTTTSSLSPQPAITAPPQVGTVSPIVDHFTTVTQTVSSGGDINIEINIINIFTGEIICRKKDSGEPCDSKPDFKPSGQVPCLTTGIFTETATAFNTVIVTVSPGMWSNGTSAAAATGVAPPLGTGTGSPVLRRGRVPMIRKRL